MKLYVLICSTNKLDLIYKVSFKIFLNVKIKKTVYVKFKSQFVECHFASFHFNTTLIDVGFIQILGY